MDQGFLTTQMPGAAFHRARAVRDPRRCHRPRVLPREKTPLVGITERESRQGNKRRGSSGRAGEDAGLGPIPARRIPQDHRPPSPGAAVMSWHREGAAGSRALEQVALARFLPPAGAPERWGWGDTNDKMSVIPLSGSLGPSAPDFTAPYGRW